MVVELKLAHSVKCQMTSGESNQYTLAVTGGTLHTVNLTENTCSCSFRRTWLILAVISSMCVCLCTFQFLKKEWCLSDGWGHTKVMACLTKLGVVPTTMHHVPQALCPIKIVFMCQISAQNLSFSEHWLVIKCFQKVQTLCQKLAAIASLCGMSQFREKYAQIETLVWNSH